MVAFVTIATTNFEPCNNMPNPGIRALLKSHKSASSIHLCASIRAVSSSLYSGSKQTQIPDVIPCYFIVKCSGFVIHHINLSHVYGSAQRRRVLPALDTSRNNLVSHWSIIF